MSVSEICTTEMCREVAPEVHKLLGNQSTYLKKKAALAAIRIIKKIPESLWDFAERLEPLLEEKNHGVLLSSI